MYILKNGLERAVARQRLRRCSTALAAFGIGNMVQANSVADVLQATFGVPVQVSGIVIGRSHRRRDPRRHHAHRGRHRRCSCPSCALSYLARRPR